MKRLTVGVAIYTALLSLYAVASYILTDPNLVFTSWMPYWRFQQWLWQQFLPQSTQLAMGYIAILLALFAAYSFLLTAVKKTSFSNKKIIILAVVVAVPLFFSYNALSHDIFNYIFNAKMLVEYQVNPHVTTALSFADDPWTRFMHNTHTAAPYGYGWTGLSVLPYLAGLGKFLLSWFSFKFMSLLSYLGICLALSTLLSKESQQWRVFLFAFNPLVLIEVLSNGHNDLWMILPAVLSYMLLTKYLKSNTHRRQVGLLFGVFVLLGLSISIKLATLVLVPVFVWALVLKWELVKLIPMRHHLTKSRVFQLQWYQQYLPVFAATALFLPLFAAQSKLFLPWYLLWSFTWLPLISKRWVQSILLAFSLSSLLRYAPWFFAGFQYSETIIFQQQLVTWVIGGVGSMILFRLGKGYNS